MGLTDKSSGIGGFKEGIIDSVTTFRTHRTVNVKNKWLAALYWAMWSLAFIYILYSIFDGYQYLTTTSPIGVVGGYGEVGTMYTGAAATPAYCSAPYTNDYYETTDWQYVNIGCARYPITDVMLKRAPTFQFFTTLMYERTYTMATCSTSSTCNTGTAGVDVVGDSCMCTTYASKYVVNPEGMNLRMYHDVNVDFAQSGTSYEGSSSSLTAHDGTTNKPIKTTIMAANGSTVASYETPDDINIQLSTILELAELDLDTYNTEPGVGKTHYHSGGTYLGGNYPYWRMTGGTIVFHMDYRNYDVTGEDAFYDDHDSKIYCVIKVEHIGSWASVGSESADFESPIRYTQGTGKMYTYNTVVVDRYRQGIKVIFSPHGSMGEVDVYAVINALLNGVVMLGVATSITTLVAKYCSPCGGFMGVFRNFQDVECRPDHVIARTAAHASAQASNFIRAFDKGCTGTLNQRMLFENIKTLCGEDLTDEQIAECVSDICAYADVDNDGDVAVDEFTHFLAPDECDLMNVIAKYSKSKGDPTKLEEINELEIDEHYKENMKKVQAGVHQINVAAGGHRSVYATHLPPPPPPKAFCTSCGQKTIKAGSNFCTACGKTSVGICRACGKQTIKPGSNFCTACGSGKPVAQPMQAQPMQPMVTQVAPAPPPPMGAGVQPQMQMGQPNQPPPQINVTQGQQAISPCGSCAKMTMKPGSKFCTACGARPITVHPPGTVTVEYQA